VKIALVTNTSWNVFNFREGLVKCFLDRGDEVIALAPKDEYSDGLIEWGVKYIQTPLDQTGTNPIKDLGYLNNIRKIFKSEKPDVALCFTIKSNIYGTIAGYITNVPTICNVSGLGTVFIVKGWVGRFVLKLYRFAFRHSAFIFFQNKDDRDLFLTFVNIDEDKIGVLPGSGLNLEKFNFVEPAISSHIKLIMISRIIEEKGVREYAEAAKIVIDKGASCTFTLVGKIDEQHSRSIPKQEIDNWVKEGFIKYFDHSDNIKELIANHEVVVLSSYREGTPRTLLEGAAIGRALIATDVPGCREVVQDGVNGFLCLPKDGRGLADKIRLYQSLSTDEKRALSGNSRKIVEEKFDENLVIGRYKETIAQIVDK
jgi:glycosyltransferase involved in cell wall biosynthesis